MDHFSWISWASEHWFAASVAFLGSLAILVVINDIFIQKAHAVQHNFPLVGHLRYFMEEIGPELRQYWVANDKEETPFDRTERAWIYTSSKGRNSTFGFGTSENQNEIGYPIIKHTAFPFPEHKATYPGDDKTAIPCLKIMGESHDRKRPYRPQSIVNISAMSFGSLGARAISALNKGASKANCYHNTGEGSVSRYHKFGADIMWQIGTGYFGARDENGKFSLDIVAKKVEETPAIRSIEIKLSQGAKPGKGGILPGAKVTAEIAETRGIPIGKDCISPNAHSEFTTAQELVDFIERVADRTGLPVGIKSAVGKLTFWEDLVSIMKEKNIGPDFISIDGSEGGTGAAPLTFADHVSLPFKTGFARIYKIFQREGIANDIVWIGSGKLGFPDRTIIALTMGCDMVQIAREAMISIGCIQAQKCHTDFCPSGVATQNWWLQRGINVDIKSERFARYIKSFRKELLALTHAAGYEHPAQFTAHDIEFSTGVNEFTRFAKLLGYPVDSVQFTKMEDYVATP